MNKVTDRPMVGVGVFCIKDGKFLLGRRKGSHGAGELALPGGHIEQGESIRDAAARELFEETGIEVQGGQIVCAGEELFDAASGKRLVPPWLGMSRYHYVTVYVAVNCRNAEPVLKEPTKCDGWQWHDIGGIRDSSDTVAHNQALWEALMRLRVLRHVEKE